MKPLFALFLVLGMLGCKQPMTNTRTSLPVSDNIIVDKLDTGLGFNLKLPDNHSDLVGAAHELANVLITENSDLIAFSCIETDGVSGVPVSKIRFVLSDASSNETQLAQFDYSCANGAKVKLEGLKTNTDYMLTVVVSNESGVTYVGNSDIFRTDDQKISVKMKRVEKESDVEVEIVFPTAPQPKSTFVTCIFEPITSTATAKTGGKCKVEILKSRLVVSNDDAATSITKECMADKGACKIDLGVLKSEPGKIEIALDGLKVTGVRNACPTEAQTRTEFLIISEKSHDRIIQVPDCKAPVETAVVSKSCNVTFNNNGRKTCEIAWPEGYEKVGDEAQPSSPGSICRWNHFDKKSECYGIRFAKFTPSDAICDCSIVFKKK